MPKLECLSLSGCKKLKSIAPLPDQITVYIGNFVYEGPEAGRMILRIKKTLRQKYLRLMAQRYLRSPAYRELVISFYAKNLERDKARLSSWLAKVAM